MTAYIKTRDGKSGRRYLVYFRRGGRMFREEYAGSFRTKKEAQTRRDLVAGELAAGRNPALLLASLREPPRPKPGLGQAWDTWVASKRGVGESARSLYRNSRDRWLPILGAITPPEEVAFVAVAAGLDEMLEDLAPNTVRLYLSHLAMVLDFALPDGAPNPARSRKIELPSGGVREPAVPSNDEWAAILKRISGRSRPAVRLMECCGFRVSEVCGLEAGDVDRVGGQLLVRRSVTKTAAGRRWMPCPPELLETVPVAAAPGQIYYDLGQACEKAKIRGFGTHAFRRRRISLWYAQQIDAPQIARWAGHSKASESMNTYAFEVVDALADEWLGFWQAAYRPAGAARVRHTEGVSE